MDLWTGLLGDPIPEALENRILGTKSRGVYEAPGPDRETDGRLGRGERRQAESTDLLKTVAGPLKVASGFGTVICSWKNLVYTCTVSLMFFVCSWLFRCWMVLEIQG